MEGRRGPHGDPHTREQDDGAGPAVAQEAVARSSPRRGTSLQEEGEHREVTGQPRQVQTHGSLPGAPPQGLCTHLPCGLGGLGEGGDQTPRGVRHSRGATSRGKWGHGARGHLAPGSG